MTLFRRMNAGKRWVYWQNLREEPLIFINGNPFVVREADKPFSNLEYTGAFTTQQCRAFCGEMSDMCSACAILLAFALGCAMGVINTWCSSGPLFIKKSQSSIDSLVKCMLKNVCMTTVL